MLPVALAIFLGGALALLVGLVLFAAFRFERFVGLRYLRRSAGSKAARLGLPIAAAVTLLGGAGLFAGRQEARSLQTIGVIVVLLGALVVMLFLLLRLFSVFTTVSTMGVVLGVASLVVVLAVTSGFEREFLRRVLVVHSHMFVISYGNPTMEEAEREASEVMRKLRGMPGLVGMAKFSLSAGEVMIGKVGANFKGVDLENGGGDLEPWLVEGHVRDLGKPAACAGRLQRVGRMLLGAELARQLHAKVGDCVSVLVPFAGDMTTPPSYLFKIVGIYRMGFHEYDARLAFVSLEDVRWLGNARQSLFGVELRFDDPMKALTAEPDVAARVGPEPKIIDWRTLNHNFFTALQMQKVIISLFLVLIIIVAAFNIVAALTMIVLSKTREIAILGSMGAPRRTILRIFLSAGSFVGFIGTGLGLVYGVLVCAMVAIYRYPLDPKVYTIAQLPVKVDVRELLFVAASTQLICLLATIYPAIRAARLKVLDGLRYT